MKRCKSVVFMSVFLLAMPGIAMSQTEDDDPTVPDDDEAPLPEPESDDDPLPPVARPDVPPGGVVEQAGVGGKIAYARSGVLELGGAAGFTAANDFNAVNVSPSIGWFLMDNVQISGIAGVSHFSHESGADATVVSLVVEPSVHVPMNREVFGFAGLGMGAAWADGPGGGLALAPRLGAKILVGRSGMLTPALRAQYTTHESVETEDGTLLAVSSQVGFDIGYTVMW